MLLQDRQSKFLVSIAGPSQLLLQSAHDERHIGCRALKPETALFLRKDPRFLADIAKSIDQDFEEDLAGMYHQREAPAVATLGPILRLV